MAQVILTKVTENEDGIVLTFIDNESKEEHSGKYTNGALTADQLKELIGTQIAFTGKEKDIGIITRAWDGNKPVYANERYAGDDRADSIR